MKKLLKYWYHQTQLHFFYLGKPSNCESPIIFTVIMCIWLFITTLWLHGYINTDMWLCFDTSVIEVPPDGIEVYNHQSQDTNFGSIKEPQEVNSTVRAPHECPPHDCPPHKCPPHECPPHKETDRSMYFAYFVYIVIMWVGFVMSATTNRPYR